jgi:predicted nucleotidyltransferase
MSVQDRERLVERLGRFLDERPEILEAYLFGSRARGDAQPHSDVDVNLVHVLLNERLEDLAEFVRRIEARLRSGGGA